MHRRFLDKFVCHKCEGSYQFGPVVSEDNATHEIIEGELICTSCGAVVPIIRRLPRFVPSESYASSFGFQWSRFACFRVGWIEDHITLYHEVLLR